MPYSFNADDRLLLAIGSLVGIVLGAWVVAAFGPLALWPYAIVITGIFGFLIAPIDFRIGRGGEAAALVWSAMILGPFARLIMLAWLGGLPGRARVRS